MERRLHVTKPEDERRVVDIILHTLAKYMIDSNIQAKFLTEVKLQKIVFKTVEELELPVTRSWYLRGCMVHPGGTLTGSIKKRTIERLVQSPEELLVNQDVYACFDNIQIKNRIFFKKGNDFLRELYRSMEPSRFRNEYIPNNELILSLDEIKKCNFNGINQVISENVSKLILGLQGDELFNNVSKNFYDFLYFMEDTCIEVEGSVEDGAEITPSNVEFFKRLSDTYYKTVWMEPASIISIETAVGVSADRVIEQRRGYLPIAAHKIKEPLNELNQLAEKLNLSLSDVNVEKAYMKSCGKIGIDAGKDITEMWQVYAK